MKLIISVCCDFITGRFIVLLKGTDQNLSVKTAIKLYPCHSLTGIIYLQNPITSTVNQSLYSTFKYGTIYWTLFGACMPDGKGKASLYAMNIAYKVMVLPFSKLLYIGNCMN